MRSLRSFLATTRSAPSSTFLRPIFQASATRIAYCSMVSGSVVGTIKTAIWLPFLSSRPLRVCVSAAISPALSVPVWSTTRPVSGGTATSAKAAKAQHSSSSRIEALAADIAVNAGLFGRRRVEIHLRRGRDFLFVLDREVRLRLVSEHHRRQVGRERTNGHIIVLYRLDIAIARYRDAIFSHLQMRHQVAKHRVGYELRVFLGHDQQLGQRAGEFALRGLEFRERSGIVDEFRRRL